jgi:glyoxylase-like metal-dependent hydrolase (beta-lactamase superfamily II)
MEIVPGIHRIATPFANRVVYQYLFVGEEKILLFDTGMENTTKEHLLPYLDQIGLSPDRLTYTIISHSDLDHQGGNDALKAAAPRILFMCHNLDKPWVESLDRLIVERYGQFKADHAIEDPPETIQWMRESARSSIPMDIGLEGGETIRLSPDWTVEVLHTPGHSFGHLTIWDPKHRTAVIGDAILWNAVPTVTGEPAFPPTYQYVDTYLSSIQRLQSMPIETLLTSHYAIQRGADVQGFLSESRAFAQRLEAATLEVLQESGQAHTARELTEIISPKVGTWPASANVYMIFPLLGHLQRLESRRQIRISRRDGLLTYQVSSS